MAVAICRYKLSQILPGMEIGRPILDRNGMTLLTEGTVLNERLLKRLASLGLTEIDIKEQSPVDNGSVLFDAEQLKIYQTAVNKVKILFNTIISYKKVPLPQFQDIASNQIAPLVDSHFAINYLNLERSRDEYTFCHCINVALLSGLIGKWLHYSLGEINELILAGLLHDIGKTQIPMSILQKMGKLSEKEMHLAQLHSTYSYSLLSSVEGLSSDVIFGILQHHERLDGSGYPGNFSSAKIHRYARIIAIADIYDAMTSDRVYKDKVTPFWAADALAFGMIAKLDVGICTAFLDQFRYSILGNTVNLKDGQEGEIVYLGEFLNPSPIIKCTNGNIIKLDDWKDITKVKPVAIFIG
jgi:HD-GYP domain-containing protein (c-di-GMP phosphodiesterase class II)